MIDETILAGIDPNSDLPEDGELRQYHFLRRMQDFTKEREAVLGRKMTACVVTFGCQMNARDSEKLAGVLEICGFTVQDDEDSDFVIFNTCTVRENADEHLFGRLGGVHHLKKKDNRKVVAICGCMTQEKTAPREDQKEPFFCKSCLRYP